MDSPMFNFYAENQQKVHKATAIKLWFFEEEKMEENEIQKKKRFSFKCAKEKMEILRFIINFYDFS